MATKYKAVHASWRPEIKAVEIERETEHTVTLLDGRRENKVTTWDKYFDSWSEAHAFLMAKAEEKVEAAREKLQRARDVLGNIKGMKKPEGA